MFKSILPVLLISTLNGAVLDSNSTLTETLQYTEVNQYQYTDIVNPEQPNPAGQTVELNTRTQFKINGNSIDVLGITYTFGYGTPSSSNNPALKRFYIASATDAENGNTQTYHSITWMQINVKKDIDDLYLEYAFAGPNTYYFSEYYYCTNNSLNDIYMNERWYEQTYINTVKQECESNIYTTWFYGLNENDKNTADILTDVIVGNTYSTLTFVILTRANASNAGYEEGPTFNQWMTPYSEGMTLQATYTNTTVINNNYEVINIPDLMFNILSMPFSFISQAFNLTLFGGTPYQINISALFLGILGAVIFIVIIKLILTHVGG